MVYVVGGRIGVRAGRYGHNVRTFLAGPREGVCGDIQVVGGAEYCCGGW